MNSDAAVPPTKSRITFRTVLTAMRSVGLTTKYNPGWSVSTIWWTKERDDSMEEKIWRKLLGACVIHIELLDGMIRWMKPLEVAKPVRIYQSTLLEKVFHMQLRICSTCKQTRSGLIFQIRRERTWLKLFGFEIAIDVSCYIIVYCVGGSWRTNDQTKEQTNWKTNERTNESMNERTKMHSFDHSIQTTWAHHPIDVIWKNNVRCWYFWWSI